MTKTLSVGIIDNFRINYVNFNFRDKIQLDCFYNDLASYIIDKYNNTFIKMIINKNYGYFDKADKAQIYKIAQNSFSNICLGDMNSHIKYIKSRIYNYFEEEHADTIILDGFARFRLKDYIDELELLVDCAVEDFFIQIEYENFILMLKELIHIQRPEIRLIHVFTEKDGRYCICDENSEELSRSHIFELIDDDEENIVNDDDFLLSALIGIAPKKIIIHNKDNINNMQLLETLLRIFDKRIILCKGCNTCDRQQSDKNIH